MPLCRCGRWRRGKDEAMCWECRDEQLARAAVAQTTERQARYVRCFNRKTRSALSQIVDHPPKDLKQ